jgi:valyl-tRNA synthetase
LELVKHRAYRDAGDPGQVSAVTALRLALDAMLRLLAPVLSFATEEVWSWRHEGSIHQAPWPSVTELALPPNDEPGALALATEALTVLRRAKTDRQLSQRSPVARVALSGPEGLQRIADDLSAVAAIEVLDITPGDQVTLTAFEPAEVESDR